MMWTPVETGLKPLISDRNQPLPLYQTSDKYSSVAIAGA